MNVQADSYVLLYSLYSYPNVILCFFGGFLLDRVFGMRWGLFFWNSKNSYSHPLWPWGIKTWALKMHYTCTCMACSNKQFYQATYENYSATTWTGPLGTKLTNQSVNWEQRVATFFVNGPMKLKNANNDLTTKVWNPTKLRRVADLSGNLASFWLVRLDPIFWNIFRYLENEKLCKPSVTSAKLQQRLLLDGIVHPVDLPSKSAISKCMREDLVMTKKKIQQVPLEGKKPINIPRHLSRVLIEVVFLSFWA